MTATEQKYSGQPTTEELTLIRDYILLPHLLTMVQRNLEDIERSGGILKKLYAQSANILMDRINKDLNEVRRQLKKANIKVHDEDYTDFRLGYPYTCRGYDGKFHIMREVLKAEISVKLTTYMGELTRSLRT